MLHRIFKATQRGDTIVEVMVSIALVSVVLVSAFYVTQRSTISVRSGQEHSEILQILQGQVEHVRALALAQKTPTDGIFAAGDFCIIKDTSNQYIRVPITDPGCKNIQGTYDIKVAYEPSTNVFTFTGNWDGLHGDKSQEDLTYRVYSGAKVVATNPQNVTSGSGDAGLQGLPPSPISCVDNQTAKGKPLYPFCWNVYIDNISNNPTAIIASCTIDWGDGSTPDVFNGQDAECQKGFRLGTHTYPNIGTKQNQKRYTITITNYFNNGLPPAKYAYDRVFVPF